MNPKADLYTFKAELLSICRVPGSEQGALGDTEMRQAWPCYQAEGPERGVYLVPRDSQGTESTFG